MTRAAVVLTAATVLSSIAEDLDGFTAALLAGRTGVRHGPGESPAALLDTFTLARWSERHLAGDAETAGRLVRVAGRATRPAQTAACVALDAVRRAGFTPGARTGLLVAGANLALDHQARTVLEYQRHPGRLRASYALTHLDADVVGVVSELTGIRGEGWTVGAGSAAGTLAVIQAARLVQSGWLDECLVVAPMAELSPVEREAFRRTGAMATVEQPGQAPRACRPFDSRRRGFVYGQAAAAVLLERADAAHRRGAPVLAELAGHGQALDARRGTEPDSAGQVAAIRAALAAAGAAPDDIDYVNTHGTGSVLGDETEARSLRTVFGRRSPLVNSTKPLVGHCLSAAGLVELVATVAQLRAGACHPNPNLDDPIDRHLAFVGGTALTGPLRTALSTSFAFGGINGSLVVRAVRPEESS
ncbi:beta-ketoacyl synthase N-terminal-like domain-containing protein [Couchioplanes azureus]|uniref:beta-ketoacyl synthase N-terminal-like domain-containing protein n=1 Tax=Couchioplanes caeruleus TaxID=56438 RepID=UPI0016713208|nr:beta-ketoacyl synthase N-terminal-like domain-containing protein [Couchioplanes caeruleus]GGQ76186.1 polyketide beta-ketoacyl:ACP synthase [Couchioplanes caeruleus subsp. azureus]